MTMCRKGGQVRDRNDIKRPTRPGARPLYIVSDVARYTYASEHQVRHWLRGYSAKGAKYEPFLQALPEQSHGSALSFENLIEIALVSVLRKSMSIQAIRLAHQYAEKEFGPLPFARNQVYQSGKDIFIKAVESADDQARHLSTVTKGGQRAWEAVLKKYLVEIDWRDGWPVEWRPYADIKLNPEVAFGLPNIQGVRTEIVRSRFMANESVEFIAEDFGLTIAQVEMALRYELQLEPAA